MRTLVSLPGGARHADLAALTDGLLDLLADRVADRVCDRLGSQAESNAWLDLNSAAEHLGIHPDTLRKRAKAGQIPFEQDGPGCRLHFRRTALDQWRQDGGAPARLARIADATTRPAERRP
jgi:excisionase family DNA binding protein